MLILRTLDGGPLHGYAIAKRIKTVSQDALAIEEGSLYPALNRMLVKGWLTAEWGISENNPEGTVLLVDSGRAEATQHRNRRIQAASSGNRVGDEGGLIRCPVSRIPQQVFPSAGEREVR